MPFLAEGHDDAGDRQGRHEHQDHDTQARQRADDMHGAGADLRRQRLQECREVGGGFRPDAVHLLADQGPFGHVGRRRRNVDGAALGGLQQVVDRPEGGDADEVDRHHHEQDADHRDQGGRPAVAVADVRAQPQVQRIQGDREDQCPQHQVEEGLEDLVAEDGQYGDQACADQDVEQLSGTVGLLRKFCGHDSYPGTELD
nr:hypothetical protein [Arenimonas daejeonensis]